jgi:hypothetical protein
VPMIEDACGRLLLIHGFRNGHPSYRVATESLVFPVETFFDAPTALRRPVRTAFHDTVRALVARARGRAGVFFPCSVARCAPPLTPLSPFPEPRVAILRERRALGSAEIVSNPHIVKRAGLRDPRRLRRLAGVPLSRCLLRDVPWPLAGLTGPTVAMPLRQRYVVAFTRSRDLVVSSGTHAGARSFDRCSSGGTFCEAYTRAPSRERLATFVQGAGMEGRASLSVLLVRGALLVRGGWSNGREETSRGAVSRCREEGTNPGSPLPDTSCHPQRRRAVIGNMTVVSGGPRSSAFGIDAVACGARIGSLGNPPREGRDPGERSRCLSFVPSDAA